MQSLRQGCSLHRDTGEPIAQTLAAFIAISQANVPLLQLHAIDDRLAQ
jgi:hypothetical protein